MRTKIASPEEKFYNFWEKVSQKFEVIMPLLNENRAATHVWRLTEDSIDTIVVEKTALEAVQGAEGTKIDRPEAGKLRLKKNFITFWEKVSQKYEVIMTNRAAIDVEEVEEDTPDVLEVVEDSWEALDTKIDRSKAGKLRRLKKNFARRRNDLPTTTGKKPEQIHRSPLPKDSIDEEEVEEDTPDVLEVVENSWEALDTKIDRSKAGKLHRLKKNFTTFWKKVSRGNHAVIE